MENNFVIEPFIEALTGVSHSEYLAIKEANNNFAYTDTLCETVLKAASVLLKEFRNSRDSLFISNKLHELSEDPSNEMFRKVAGVVLECNNSFIKSAGPVTEGSALAKLLLAAPIVAGGVGGAAYWALNQQSKEDSSKNEQLKAKIRYFKSLSSEIEQDIASKYPKYQTTV